MFKKYIKTLFPVLLVILLVIAAAGCGRSGGNSGTENGGGSADSLDGTYTGGAGMTEAISESSGLDIQTELVMHFILTLTSGKDYTMELDVDQFIADTKVYYETEMPSLIRQSLINEGYTDEQIEEVVKQQGYASFDDFAGAYLETVLANLDEQFANTESLVSKGTYKVNGQKISLQDESGVAVATDGTIESDGSLTLELTLSGQKSKVVFKK